MIPNGRTKEEAKTWIPDEDFGNDGGGCVTLSIFIRVHSI